MGLSNLPPGVTDSMLPGNRPEDQEVIATIVFTVGEIQEFYQFAQEQKKVHLNQRSNLGFAVIELVDQLGAEGALRKAGIDHER